MSISKLTGFYYYMANNRRKQQAAWVQPIALLPPAKTKNNFQPIYTTSEHHQPTKQEVGRAAAILKVSRPVIYQKLGNGVKQWCYDRILEHGPSAVNKIGNYANNKVKDYFATNFNNNNSNSNGGNMGSNSGTSNPKMENGPNLTSALTIFKGNKAASTNTTYALSAAPSPRPIAINSGIKPNTYVNDYMVPMEGLCSPLHMTGAILSLPSNPTNPLYSYLVNTIFFDVQTRCQANVGFGVDITTILTTSNLLTAFNAVITGLQTYFYYSSILTYESDSRNRNSGMTYLRQQIDTTMYADVVQLGKRLEDTPIPPRIVEWVRYMCGNFYSSNTQGSPIIKIFFNNTQHTPSALSPTLAASALTALSTPTNVAVFSLIRRCIPQWRTGKLYDCPIIPTFDKNFLTIFANLINVNRASGLNVFSNTVATTSVAANYNTYTNNLDGLAFSMGHTYDTALSQNLPGFIQTTTVNAGFPDNRYSYYTVGGVTKFYPVQTLPFLAASRQESTVNFGTTSYTPHLFGTDRCQAVTGNALIQSGQSSLDFLFETVTSKRKGPMNNIIQFSS